jgi:hypothetical protein
MELLQKQRHFFSKTVGEQVLVSAPLLVRQLMVIAVLSVCAGALQANVLQYVPAGVNCQDSSRCGLYMDISGNASVNWNGSDSFSYQPQYTLGAYRHVVDEASAMAAGGIASTQAQTNNFATFGALKASQSSGTTSTGALNVYPYLPHASSSSHSRIGFQDRLTINAAPSLTNQLGTMTGRVRVTGGVSASPATYPQDSSAASASVTVPGAAGTYSVAAYGDKPGTGGIPYEITFELSVKFNSTDFTALAFWLDTSANTSALYGFGLSHAVTASSNFFSTLEWMAIDSVRDSQGNVITGWNVTSASGFDYSRSYASQVQAVPVPASSWLLGSGLLGLAGMARRRKQVI